MTKKLVIGVVALLVLVMKLPVAGQTSASGPDVLSSLLVEVRSLRAAIEQLAAAGPRVQLAMGRLQLQEQRINTLLRRLDEVRDRLAGAEQDAARIQRDLTRMQSASQQVLDPKERQALEEQTGSLKAQFEFATAKLQRLRMEQGETAASVASEQGRWTEINQRLEELERALGRR